MQPRLLPTIIRQSLTFDIACRFTRSSAPNKLLPVLDEKDLQESFVRSAGAGGQNVNKRETCVLLTHIPTGISVKVQDQRTQERNRKIARQRMRELLDEHFNGEDSLIQQREQKFTLKKQSKYEKSLLSLERRQRFKEQLAELQEKNESAEETNVLKFEETTKAKD